MKLQNILMLFYITDARVNRYAKFVQHHGGRKMHQKSTQTERVRNFIKFTICASETCSMDSCAINHSRDAQGYQNEVTECPKSATYKLCCM